MIGDDAEDKRALERRVESLEEAVRDLAAEMRQLRAAHQTNFADPYVESRPGIGSGTPSDSAAPLPAAVPYAQTQTPKAWQTNFDLEALVGRYGTLVLATVLALAAVGTFLGWAISHGLLGPPQRIALGLITAAGLAVGGMRLRRRERSFGASLLGLSLAVTHVCAWGAGPSLNLMPTWAAFLFAAAASIALAAFAHAEHDEPLWSVGFSGAAIAPFVTSTGEGNVVLLTAYGMAVLVSAGYALGGRPWIVAARIFLVAAFIYTGALSLADENDGGPLLAMTLPLVVACAGVLPWVSGWSRRERLRALGAFAGIAALRTGLGTDLPFDKQVVAAMIAAAGLVWLVLVDRTHDVADATPAGTRKLYEGDWLDAGILPIGFVAAALAALDASARGSGVAAAAAAVVLLVAIARFRSGAPRDAAVFATLICALIAAVFLARGRPLMTIGSIAVLSAMAFAGNRLWRSVSWKVLGLIGIGWSALASFVYLLDRTRYEYTPFLTTASAAAATVLACAMFAWWTTDDDEKFGPRMRIATLAWAFIWVHQEIMFAVSPTIATLLRVTYYAATSVAAVGIGRARGVPVLRHIGLGLAVVAAVTALYAARRLDAVGARIAADLVASVFLLAIAYWYRRPGLARQAEVGRI